MDGLTRFEIEKGVHTYVGYGLTLSAAKADAEFKANGGVHTWLSDPKYVAAK